MKKKATGAEKKKVTKNLSTTTVHPADSIARVRDLAWTGNHAQAIDLYFGYFMPSGRMKPKRESIPGNLTPVKTELMDRTTAS